MIVHFDWNVDWTIWGLAVGFGRIGLNGKLGLYLALGPFGVEITKGD